MQTVLELQIVLHFCDHYKDCDKQHQLLEWVEQFEQLFSWRATCCSAISLQWKQIWAVLVAEAHLAALILRFVMKARLT